jgi:hypothetical protein
MELELMMVLKWGEVSEEESVKELGEESVMELG